MAQRFQVHPLQSIQKRDSAFSKSPTCFEAQLTILDPELADQRDYTLVVQNERGHQSATVRLRVSSPLSPVLMITSAFVTICGLFLFSLVVMFLIKKRQPGNSVNQNGNQINGLTANGREKSSVEHLVNGNGNSTAIAAAAVASAQLMQQTRGIVNGSGNGLANNASNPIGANGNKVSGSPMMSNDDSKLHMLSMASSDTSGDQKQLLVASDRNSSSSSTTNHCADFSVNSVNSINGHSTTNSSPSPMNHISVDDEPAMADSSTYQAAECITNDAELSPNHSLHLAGQSALIYANLDYPEHHSIGLPSSNNNTNRGSQDSNAQHSSMASNSTDTSNHLLHTPIQRRQQTPLELHQSPTNLSNMTDQSMRMSSHHQVSPMSGEGSRTSVGATIAMMNSLAAANNQPVGSPAAGVLNGAISQQLANNRLRKPGPPKPPKPTIQQRSRFYQQQQQHQQSNGNGLVMIGGNNDFHGSMTADHGEPTANELAVEYSRIAFQTRAEL